MAQPSAPKWLYNMEEEMNYNKNSLLLPLTDSTKQDPALLSKEEAKVSKEVEAEVDWNTGLCECEDAATCCYGFWCCPCMCCTVSRKLQEPYCLPLCDTFSIMGSIIARMPVIAPPVAFGLRMVTRKRYNIRGTLLNDIVVSCCCTWCSWCQMHRELKHQIKDPNIINVQNVVSVQPTYGGPTVKTSHVALHNTVNVNSVQLDC